VICSDFHWPWADGGRWAGRPGGGQSGRGIGNPADLTDGAEGEGGGTGLGWGRGGGPTYAGREEHNPGGGTAGVVAREASAWPGRQRVWWDSLNWRRVWDGGAQAGGRGGDFSYAARGTILPTYDAWRG